MKWNDNNTLPPHLNTVLGWYPEYDEEDERYYQLVYYNVLHDTWHPLSTHDECAAPEQWAAIIAPVVDDQLKKAS